MSEPEERAEDDSGACAAGPRARLPRWVAVIFLAVCLGLIPQIVHLSSTLTETQLANHWRTAWVGLDIAEAVIFFLTAWLLYRRSRLVTVTASMAAVMLWLDAWFDVLTAYTRADIDSATNLAIFLEVPLGLFCLYIALCPLGCVPLPSWRRRRDAGRR